MAAPTFTKQERLCSRKLTERLFSGMGSRSMAAYPVRLVWMETDEPQAGASAQVLISVSKRRFKRAVKRNRVKRQIREAYRHAKLPLLEKLDEAPGRAVVMAFIWLSDELYPSAVVDGRIRSLVNRLTEKL